MDSGSSGPTPGPAEAPEGGRKGIFSRSSRKDAQSVKQEAELVYKIVLDKNIHVGPADAVTGRVVINCRHLQGFAGDLFGPLRVAVMLSGRTKTKTRHRRGQNTVVRRARAPLFAIREVIYEGPITIGLGQQHETAFSMNFPATPQPRRQNGTQLPDRYNHEDGAQLPPSMMAHHFGFANYEECYVQYGLTAEVSMANMANVRISHIERPRNVRYQQKYLGPEPVSSPPHRDRQKVTVSNAQLLPEAERPSSLKEKTRAYFKSDYYPTFMYRITTFAPSAIHIGTTPEFSINISTAELEDSITSKIRPSIELYGLQVIITAGADLRTEGNFTDSTHEDTVREVVYSSGSELGKVIATFDDEHGWERTFKTAPLPLTMTPQFTTFNINVWHGLEVKWYLRCAGKETEHTSRYLPRGVQIAPPLGGGEVEVVADALPLENIGAAAKALEAGDSDNDDADFGEQLPSYASAAGPSSGQAQSASSQAPQAELPAYTKT